jgi:antitoxin component HigA of HigAB toxin-antitoxin module
VASSWLGALANHSVMNMETKPIRTEKDYEAALARLEAIFDAEPGTPEGDELEILASLVQTYERTTPSSYRTP